MEDIIIHSLQTEGLAACASLLEPVVLKRRAVLREKMRLLETTIRSTVENIFGDSAWDDKTNPNPFGNLPNVIIVKLIETIFEIYCNNKELLEPKQLQAVQLMLQRCSSIDLDLDDWKSQPLNGDKLMDYLRQSSPELQRLVDTSHITGPSTHVMWSNNIIANELPPEFIDEYIKQSLLMQAQTQHRWHKTSLQRIKFTLPSHCTMATAPIWENIRVLKIYFPIYHFERFDTANLEGLNKLKEMHIKLKFNGFSKQDLIVPKLLELVQHLPSLQILGCDSLHMHLQLGAEFVTKFGHHAVSERALLVDRLSLGWKHAPENWASNLGVRNLSVSNPASQLQLAKIIAMPTDKLEELELDNVEPEFFGVLVVALAPGVKKIKIKAMTQSVDLYGVLMTCPQVVDFEVDLDMSVTANIPMELLDEVCVKTIKRFVVPITSLENGEAVLKLFENILKFSEALEELEFSDIVTMNVALATLKQHPTCGAHTRRLNFNLYYLPTTVSQMISKVMELAAFLTLRSPNMEKVTINVCDQLPIEKYQWFQELAHCLEVKFEVVLNGRHFMAFNYE